MELFHSLNMRWPVAFTTRKCYLPPQFTKQRLSNEHAEAVVAEAFRGLAVLGFELHSGGPAPGVLAALDAAGDLLRLDFLEFAAAFGAETMRGLVVAVACVRLQLLPAGPCPGAVAARLRTGHFLVRKGLEIGVALVAHGRAVTPVLDGLAVHGAGAGDVHLVFAAAHTAWHFRFGEKIT